MASAPEFGAIVVAGDMTMDWNLAWTHAGRDNGAGWNVEDSVQTHCQRGGAVLLGDLLEFAVGKAWPQGSTPAVQQALAPDSVVVPGDHRYHHSYALWSRIGRERAWRVERNLGIGRRSAAEHRPAVDGLERLGAPDLVVLDDAGLGFRLDEEAWPLPETAGRPPWVVLKMSAPVASGPLWDRLHSQMSERLVVVVTIDDLRLSAAQISRELSWESSAQDLAWELAFNPSVNALSRCAHVVVSFGPSGALVFSRPDAPVKKNDENQPPASRFTLLFDPTVIEGMWELEHPGGMIGYTSCLAASLALQLVEVPDAPDIELGARRGLAAMRTLHLVGYGERGASADKAPLSFPIEAVAEELLGNSRSAARDTTSEVFAATPVPDPTRHEGQSTGDAMVALPFWTILQDRYPETLEHVAEQIVEVGLAAALSGVPLGRFGKLNTIDRREIEGYRSIRSLVGEYARQATKERPLSIAVFGAPGSGKSFGIKQLAKGVLPGKIEERTFNLSQFNDPRELIDAFHEVRDVGLSELMPLVFWDEFDTTLRGQPLGWLRYFLAPMQDGVFQQGQVSHPLGPGIFVFAGGTSPTMEHFGTKLTDDEFAAAKGPDFVSRLKGHVNIMGPNPIGDDPAADPYYIIRRAVILRSILERVAPALFDASSGTPKLQIDRGVLRAFLRIDRYEHGVRSIETIVATSLLTGKRLFERSALQAPDQLDGQVDGHRFVALMQEAELEGELLERLAEGAHDVFCAGKRRDGFTLGPRDATKKTHPLLVPYAGVA